MLAERLDEARAVLAQVEKQWKGQVACPPGAAGGVISHDFGGMPLSRHTDAAGILSVGLHEVVCGHDDGAASVLAWQLAQMGEQRCEAAFGGKSVFWIRQRRAIDQGGFYHLSLPGLALEPPPLMMTTDQQVTALWACEEVVKSGQVASVILETTDYGLTAARRLQLACEKAGTRLIVLRKAQPTRRLAPSSALTRWKIEPSGDRKANMTGNIHHLSLIGGRGVRPGGWRVEVNATTFSISVVDTMENRLPPERPRCLRG
jgi:protein ImuA